MKQKSSFFLSEKFIFIFKMALGSGIAWQISVWAGSRYPYLSAISVIICLQATINKSIHFGISRMIGTVFGIIVTILLSAELPLKGWTIAIVLLICAGVALMFGANMTSIHQIALSTLLILVFAPHLHGYGLSRLIDTAIGIIVTLLIHAYIVPPNFTTSAMDSINQLKAQLITKLESLAVWIENGASNQNFFKEDMNQNVMKCFQDTAQQINKAENSLRYHPYSKKSKKILLEGSRKFSILRKEFYILESFYDTIQLWNSSQPLTSQEREYWADCFRKLADCLISFQPMEKISLNGKSNFTYHDLLTIEVNRFLTNLESF
ncbi:FUSC family protein [Bacillus sp. FJAT-49736]|uniref:FUSC family protein n=1 Tax=Bacillus sp. FJAT-49736 TaxID=2833582 RepID=UPI001BC96805|nr:FUSC family protein [Bacillus sp. FJAT-49736]MBS4172663.1 FUSC family protein [Bacillus sp. FJAT-49736]